ncbi:class I SAM-dependent methyltransferase [Nonomuraea bangladeshensis]
MPARVLDVGGGIGVHAEWLSADCYAVELLDPVPRHVQRAARLAGVSAPLGDARPLPVADASQDAVLLLGPLYHLPDRADRVRDPDRGPARPETRRRDRGCDDQPSRGRARRHLPGALPPGTATGGRTRSGDERDHAFSRARIPGLPPRPRRGAGEFADAGFPDVERYGLEGGFWLYGDIGDWLEDPDRRALLLDAQRSMESVPSLLGVSGHLLSIAERDQ